MKIRHCVVCNSAMTVPIHSARKICEDCIPKYNRDKSKKHYEKAIKDGRVEKYRQNSRENNKEKLKDNIPLKLYIQAKGRAKVKNLPFNIDVEDIVIPNVCPVFGTEFIKGTYYTASLDRIDSLKGYVKGNIQVMSWKANTMKNSASKEELIKFANWIFNESET